MAISEEAQRNHELLFPNHTSTLEETDPGLREARRSSRAGTLDALRIVSEETPA
jgi:hypothetical protein